jgi:hypothetical protein
MEKAISRGKFLKRHLILPSFYMRLSVILCREEDEKSLYGWILE